MSLPFSRLTSAALHDEHAVTVDLLARIERAFGALRPAAVPTVDAALRAILVDLRAHLAGAVGPHFDFEESSIFPLLEDAGEGDIAALLRDEHAAIRATAESCLPLVEAALAGGLDAGGWRELGALLRELVERQFDHIQKETVGLLPMLDDLLDDEHDRRLSLAHAGG